MTIRSNVLLCALALPAAIAPATVIHDTFAPGHGYQPSAGWSIQRNGSSRTDHAMMFIAGTAGILDSVDVAVSHISGPNRITLDLLTSVNGLPGTSLGSWTIDNGMAEYGTNNAPVTFTNSNSGLVLTQGAAYWLLATTPNGTQAAWNLNSVSVTELIGQRQNGGSWSLFNGASGAFDLSVTPTPAPGALAVLGLSGALASRRRR